MSLVKSIQPHNVKNVVYLGMHSDVEAETIASIHQLKHFIECEGKKVPIPIYVESSAVDVRIHDLPDQMDNVTIIDHMRQYGEVITIRNEVWKSYFPGLSNGVRVVKIKLATSIPSFITVNDEITMVSYHNQVKTCRNCGHKSHPKQRCSEVASAAPKNNNSNTETNKTKNSNEQQLNATNNNQRPASPNPTPSASAQQQNQKPENKRSRPIDSDTSDNETKKLNADDSSERDSSSVSVSGGDICPYTQRPYQLPDVSHIENPDERSAMIDDYKRRFDAAYSAQRLQKIRQKISKKL